MKHKVFVYGTLRRSYVATYKLYAPAIMQMVQGTKGATYPAVQLVPNSWKVPPIVGEVLEYTSYELELADMYEGVSSGLYVRKKVVVESLSTGDKEEVWCYLAGKQLEIPLIYSGDWLNNGINNSYQ